MRKIAVFISFMMLMGCVNAKHNIQEYGVIDKNEKTITVETGNSGLGGAIKRELYNKGWKLKVDVGADKVVGTTGKNTDLSMYSTFLTRYRMELYSRKIDTCVYVTRSSQPLISYEMSIIDNKLGEEVVAMDGDGCRSDVINDIVEALDGLAR